MNNLIIFFIIFLLLFLSCRLILVVSIHRHGARTPEKYFNKSWFSVGKKQLTPLGVDQMISLGTFYRTKYMPLLTNSENPHLNPIYISSPIKRTIDSAKNVYIGLNGGNVKNYHEIPIDQWSNDYLSLVKNDSFNIFVEKNESDYLFHGFKKNMCPKAHRLMEEWANSRGALIKLHELRESFFPILSKSLKKTMNISVDPQYMTYSNMKGIYDAIISCKTHNVSIDFGLSDEAFEKLSKERRDYIVKYKLGHPEVIKLSTSKFFEVLKRIIIEKKNKALSEFQSHPHSLLKHSEINLLFKSNSDNYNDDLSHIPSKDSNMILFSGHDTVVNLIINALLTENEKEKLGSMLDLTYGSHIDFELHEENNQFFIKISLNEKSLDLEKCNRGVTGRCKIEKFEELLDKSIVLDLEYECNN